MAKKPSDLGVRKQMKNHKAKQEARKRRQLAKRLKRVNISKIGEQFTFSGF